MRDHEKCKMCILWQIKSGPLTKKMQLTRSQPLLSLFSLWNQDKKMLFSRYFSLSGTKRCFLISLRYFTLASRSRPFPCALHTIEIRFGLSMPKLKTEKRERKKIYFFALFRVCYDPSSSSSFYYPSVNTERVTAHSSNWQPSVEYAFKENKQAGWHFGGENINVAPKKKKESDQLLAMYGIGEYCWNQRL